jgi:hypothetical protein
VVTDTQEEYDSSVFEVHFSAVPPKRCKRVGCHISEYDDICFQQFNNLKLDVRFLYGRAIAEAVSRWVPTAAARVQSRVWSSGICGLQSGAGFLRVLRFPLPFIPSNSPSSQSPGTGTIGQ